MRCTGHFLLTNLLTTDLKNRAADGGDARVVVLTSSLHDVSANKPCRSASTSFCSSVSIFFSLSLWVYVCKCGAL